MHLVPEPESPVRLGLRENVAQFSLLVIVNAFVGAMVGMERSILPTLAEQEFIGSALTRGPMVFAESFSFADYVRFASNDSASISTSSRAPRSSRSSSSSASRRR